MPQIDVEETVRAAGQIRACAEELRDLGGNSSGVIRLTVVADQMPGSSITGVLHALHSTLQLRLYDASTEFTAVADGLTVLARNVDLATGGRGRRWNPAIWHSGI